MKQEAGEVGMDWNVVSAIATVVGTVLTFISILVAVSLDRKKRAPSQRKTSTQPGVRTSFTTDYAQRYDPLIPVADTSSVEEPLSPCDPILYISVGLIGACGGVASILVPWLLLEASPDFQFILYPLLVLGVIGGVAFALIMDVGFKMGKIAPPWLRFPLSAISGVIGGWLGLLIVIGGIIYLVIYLALTSEGDTSLKG
jgi:hypothetical protein